MDGKILPIVARATAFQAPEAPRRTPQSDAIFVADEEAGAVSSSPDWPKCVFG
jgi:hypothetical protein